MGALCSGRSENPSSLEPPKSNLKANGDSATGVPKSHSTNKAGVALHTDEYSLSPQAKL
jgi:hypothetical protein